MTTTPTSLILTPETVQEIATLATSDPLAFSQLLEQFAEHEQFLILDAMLEAPSAPPAPPTTPKAKKPKKTFVERYEARKEYDRQRHRQINQAGRDIGPPAKVVDMARREAARTCLRTHLETYHPRTFNRPWAGYHLRLFDRIQTSVWYGGWFAMAVPRGGGKTAICQGAIEWALLHGHKRWPILIGATEDIAKESLKNIKEELTLNDLLWADFPEIVGPIRALEGSSRRCEGQLICGTPTRSLWGETKIVLPTVPAEVWDEWAQAFDAAGMPRPARVGGNRLSVAGLTGSFRGKSEKTAELDMIRPDFALPDDPQTRESAKSFTQSQYRHQILVGDVAYLSGGSQKMSVVVPCTVIYRGDMADRLLDPEVSAEWQPERHKMLESMPTRLDLWDEYAEIRRDCLRRRVSTQPATDFYAANREQMDLGAVATWPERFYDDELSAIQHAMNLKIKDEIAFYAEAQNDPIGDATTEALLCPLNDIMDAQSHCDRLVVPHYAAKVVAHLDVQQSLLYRTVLAGSLEFETAVIDYGSYPDQHRNYYHLAESLRTIAQEFPGDTLSIQLYRAIQAAIADLAMREYIREDGAKMSLDLIMVDCGYMTSDVIKACRESPWRNIVLPVQGISVQAKDTPLSLRRKKDGETKGHEWIRKPKPDTPSVIYGQVNANAWKTQTHSMFLTHTGPGSLKLWKDRPERHRMFAEHCHAETPRLIKYEENEVVEWEIKPNRPDNHHFDNVSNCLAGLSMCGCVLPSHEVEEVPAGRTPKRITRDTITQRS